MRTPPSNTTRGLLVVLVALLLAAGVIVLLLGGGGDDPDQTAVTPVATAPPAAVAPPARAPDTFSAAERRAIARDQERAAAEDHGSDEPDPDLEARTPSTTVETGATGEGALARALPATRDGWRFVLQSASAARGVFVVIVTPLDGRRVSLGTAERALRGAASAVGDDPSGYRAVVPMSVLQGARHQEDTR